MILEKIKLWPQERLDLVDINAMIIGAQTDANYLTKSIFSSSSYVLRGFEVTGIGGKSAYINMTNAALVHGANTENYSYFVAQSGASYLTLADADLIDGAPITRNYVEMKLVETDGTLADRIFWDKSANSGDGAEFKQQVNTATYIEVELEVNTSGFTGDPDRIPLCFIDTDVSGNITVINDKRPLFWRLGTPTSPSHSYYWDTQYEPVLSVVLGGATGPFTIGETVTFSGNGTATGVVVALGIDDNHFTINTLNADDFFAGDTLTGSLSLATGTVVSLSHGFTGADSSIVSIKDWLDAMMTEIKTLKGSTYWYEPVMAGSGAVYQGTGGRLPIYFNPTDKILKDYYEQNGNEIHLAIADHIGLGATRNYTISDVQQDDTFQMADNFARNFDRSVTPAALDIDWSAGRVFHKIIAADSPITFSETSDYPKLVRVSVEASGAYRVAWPNYIVWDNTVPVSQAPSAYADNGGGLVRVTVATAPATGTMVTISGYGGAGAYNGDWIVTNINGTTFDLVGSTYNDNHATKGTCVSANNPVQTSTKIDIYEFERIDGTVFGRRVYVNCTGNWPYGVDGALSIGNGVNVNVVAGTIKDYSSIDIEVGGTLTITGNSKEWTIIGCTGHCHIHGTVNCKGNTSVGTGTTVSPDGISLSATLVQNNGGAGGAGGNAHAIAADGTGAAGHTQTAGVGGYGGGGGSASYDVKADGSGIAGGYCIYSATFWADAGDGHTGGAKGTHGKNLYIRCKGVFNGTTGTIDLSGSAGSNGAAGHSGTRNDFAYSVAAGGGGSGGGAGGSGGNIIIHHAAAYGAGDIAPTLVYTGGAAGNGLGGGGGSKGSYAGNSYTAASAGSNGTAGNVGTSVEAVV